MTNIGSHRQIFTQDLGFRTSDLDSGLPIVLFLSNIFLYFLFSRWCSWTIGALGSEADVKRQKKKLEVDKKSQLQIPNLLTSIHFTEIFRTLSKQKMIAKNIWYLFSSPFKLLFQDSSKDKKMWHLPGLNFRKISLLHQKFNYHFKISSSKLSKEVKMSSFA